MDGGLNKVIVNVLYVFIYYSATHKNSPAICDDIDETGEYFDK